MTDCQRNHQAIYFKVMAPFCLGPGNVRGHSSSSADPTVSQLLPFTIVVASKQHFSLRFLFLCSCCLVVFRIFHVFTKLLFISLTEMFTQIISPFLCIWYIVCVWGTHTSIWTCVCPFVCTCEGQSRTLGVFLNYFLPRCLERRSPTELEVCCPSCVGCLVVLGL